MKINKKRFAKQIERNKKRSQSNFKKNNKSMKPKGKSTPDEVLKEDYKRILQYIPVRFEKKDIPLTQKDLRNYVKKELSKDEGLRFLTDAAVLDSSYDNLVNEIFTSKQYVEELKAVETFIDVKGKTREGIYVSNNKKYYFKIITPKKKSGKFKQKPYKRYYSVKTGKQVKAIDVNTLEILSEREEKKELKKERIEKMKREKKIKSAKDKLYAKRKKQERIKKLRGKK